MINIMYISDLDLVYKSLYMNEYDDGECFKTLQNDDKTLYRLLLWL